MNYKIRKISDINVALLNEFYKAAYPNRYNNLNNHWRWYYRMGYNNFEPIIIEVNSKIIGIAGLISSKLKYCNKVSEAIWFTDFFILKEFRNKGYGLKLINHLIKEAKKLNIVKLSLETGAGNFFQDARKLFIECGFETCDPFSHYKIDANSIYMTMLISNK